MFTRKKKAEDPLDTAYTRAVAWTEMFNPDDEEYAKTVDQIVKLHSIKTAPSPNRVSPDTMAIVGANLAGIAAVLFHEQAHVVASKAFSLIMKAAR
jgi:hypothetical protein